MLHLSSDGPYVDLVVWVGLLDERGVGYPYQVNGSPRRVQWEKKRETLLRRRNHLLVLSDTPRFLSISDDQVRKRCLFSELLDVYFDFNFLRTPRPFLSSPKPKLKRSLESNWGMVYVPDQCQKSKDFNVNTIKGGS